MSLSKIIEVGKELKAIRTKEGITQEEMSIKLGIPHSTYANYERNNRMPSKDVLDQIQLLFNVNARELINRATQDRDTNEISEMLLDWLLKCDLDVTNVKGKDGKVNKIYIRDTENKSRLTLNRDDISKFANNIVELTKQEVNNWIISK